MAGHSSKLIMDSMAKQVCFFDVCKTCGTLFDIFWIVKSWQTLCWPHTSRLLEQVVTLTLGNTGASMQTGEKL